MVISKLENSKTGAMTERVRRLKEQLFEAEVRISIERMRFLLDTYKNGKEQPQVLKRAEFTDRMLSNMTIYIDENPVVGMASEYPRGSLFFPESSCDAFTNETSFRAMLGNLKITEEDAKILKEVVDYWKDKSAVYKINEMVSQLHPEFLEINKTSVWAPAPYKLGKTTGFADYGKVLNKGLNSLIQEAEEAMAKLPLGEADSIARKDYLNAVIITFKAVIKFAKRYASLAREMARNEVDHKRKTELEKIAATCDRVPANPARDFYEAVQSFWFTHLAQWMECTEGNSPGRFTWYMYPFYEKDSKASRITEEEATELIELLYLKMMSIEYMMDAVVFSQTQASRFQNLNLGGLTPSGDDATNKLDFICLEAQRRVRLVQPTLSVLYHPKMSEEFLFKCVDVIRETGLGQPQFVNFPFAVQRTLYYHKHASLEDARSAAYMGCQPFVPQGKSAWILAGTFNSAKLLELVLNNGKDPVSGLEVGPKTGEAEEFRSYDEFKEAVRRQAQYFLPKLIQYHLLECAFRSKLIPQVFQSALNEDCIKKGKDILDRGTKYTQIGTDFVATIDLANSLAAIKKLIFEEKAITMKELLSTLKVNFEGKDDVHRMLLQAPKFGNDDEYVDQIARWCYDMLDEEYQKASEASYSTAGIGVVPEAYSVTQHFYFGRMTGALPSGRKAGLPLTDATVSPMPGTDRYGPTAAIYSAARAMDMQKWGSNHFNMKFLPSALEGREGARKLLDLVRAYMDLGGSHVQFNCVSNKTLKDAQAHPEKHRDLVVRVAGFSAYFIQLSKEIQDEIIRRSELTL